VEIIITKQYAIILIANPATVCGWQVKSLVG